MKNSFFSTRWFPSCEFCADNDALTDQLFDDFDLQAEQLSGHDQSYLQLTPGPFEGRFLSAFLGKEVAIHMEFCNQALEQEVSGSPDHFTLGVTLSEQAPFLIKGRELLASDLFILPPSGNLHLVSPTNAAIMAIAIERNLFMEQLYMAHPFLDWVGALSREVGVLRLDRLAHRVREDAIAALEAVSSSAEAAPTSWAGRALANSITTKISLEWGSVIAYKETLGTQSFDRYQIGRNHLLCRNTPPDRSSEIANLIQVSKRTVEQAFSSSVSVGPLTYSRILRLHQVRRKLMDPSMATLSIGDIAAEHGFWDWSRFSQHYRRQFGSLPSAARPDH